MKTITALKMHPTYLGVWIAFLVYVFSLELMDPQMQRPKLWIAAAVWFAVVETVALIRRKLGDTLSETVWTFNDGKWGRRVFAGSLGAYFALRLFMFGGLPLAHWVPRAVLMTGFGVWLAVHLWTRGRDA